LLTLTPTGIDAALIVPFVGDIDLNDLDVYPLPLRWLAMTLTGV
jgi:hypothetical protein